MRRLEYSRPIRCAPGRARNTAEAVMYLAHVTRERHRLEQERRSLETRIRKIEKRLTMITDTETKLAPSILLGGPRAGTPEEQIRSLRVPRMASPDVGGMQVTLQY